MGKEMPTCAFHGGEYFSKGNKTEYKYICKFYKKFQHSESCYKTCENYLSCNADIEAIEKVCKQNNVSYRKYKVFDAEFINL